MRKQRTNIDKKTRGKLLLLQVPRTSDKLMESTDYLLSSLFTLLDNNIVGGKHKQRLSLEIAVLDKIIGFYIWTPASLRQLVKEQIYSQYPLAQISEVKDYVNLDAVESQISSEIRLANNDALPIKLGSEFKTDPMLSITATLSELKDDEQAWIQIIITPVTSSWHNEALKYSEMLKHPTPSIIKTILGIPNLKVSEANMDRSGAVIAKSQKPAFQTTIRIVYRGNSKLLQAKIRLQAIVASFMQFNTPSYNAFSQVYLGNKDEFIGDYHLRVPSSYVSILNTEEIAGIYHLPHSEIGTPNISWSDSKMVEPPANLPTINQDTPEALKPEVSEIAFTNYRDQRTVFGLPRADRARHLYILGQTGVGKSALLELLTIADINSPYGFAIIDPHGDYAINVLRRIPKNRIKDVVYINPADIDYPIAFNPLEIYDPRLKNHICGELLNVLKPIFDGWNPRLEYMLRNSILALLDYPDATMLDIPRLLMDAKFREQVMSLIEDRIVAHFWTDEYEQWIQDYSQVTVEPILNKIGEFTTNPIIRNIISHSKSSFNIRQIMDEGKILIVNLSQGLIGEENATLLGSLIVSSIQRAAMSRADIEDIDLRVPFYLYVDEFQNFATDSFKTILSEARKYGLMLTMANQYIDQMSVSVQEAIFGNIGSIIAFRLSANDANLMIKYFEPNFTDHDLVHLHNRHIAVNMTVGGQRVPAFSAETINLPSITDNNAKEIIAASRAKFAVAASGVDSRMLYMSKSDLRKTQIDKNELVRDIGHYVRTKTVSGQDAKKIKKPRKTSAVKKLLTRRMPSKAIDLDEDKSIRFH
ncbi:MAG TPA: DUF87 domain-containing protein [Candidatus Dormibacteraeota bacterium]|nr:DUF87 domain-containing protein [Candidatus Dormibacteraeota bacterium]